MRKYILLFMLIVSMCIVAIPFIAIADEYTAYEIPFNSSYNYGVIDSSGTVKVSATYLYIGNYHDGLAKAKDSNGWLYIDTSGREVFRASLCTEVGDFHEGLAKAK
ncbi:MAG: WG repeat-containing protein, partial [Oscillospiraceae bacterium]|nr:WG repeat-containing protein [Oscillospiraceae bacterium]